MAVQSSSAKEKKYNREQEIKKSILENIQANASKEIQSEMQTNMGAEAVKAIRLKKIKR